MKTVYVAIFALAVLFSQQARSACLQYPQRVLLTGTLVKQTRPGPPNYASIAKGDVPEIYIALALDHPVCIDADPADLTRPAIPTLTELQLVTSPDVYRHLNTLLGRPVRLSGMLMAAETGHHHTPALLQDVTLEQ